MKLTHLCIVTEDVKRLSDFYRTVLNIEPNEYGNDYVEFETEGAFLSIYSLKMQENITPNLIQAKSNKNLIREFEVEDVDSEFFRIQKTGIEIAKKPTVQDWGTKSFYFKDSDGNIVSFYSNVEKK